MSKQYVTPLLHPLHPPKQGARPLYIGIVTPVHPKMEYTCIVEYIESDFTFFCMLAGHE